MEREMKLLMENWRQYLDEDESKATEEELFAILRQKRQEKRGKKSEPLREAEESVSYLEDQMPVGEIYCDMDGVLADFAGGILDLIHEELKEIDIIKRGMVHLVAIAGKLEYQLKILKAKLKDAQANKQDPTDWEESQRLAQEYFEVQGDPNWWEGLFENLPALPAGAALWNLIGPYGVVVLTGAPGGSGVLHAKVRWAERNLSPAPKHIIKQSNKSPYAVEEDGKPNLLIDDWSHNLQGWEGNGGIAIAFDETDSEANLRAVSDVLVGER